MLKIDADSNNPISALNVGYADQGRGTGW